MTWGLRQNLRSSLGAVVAVSVALLTGMTSIACDSKSPVTGPTACGPTTCTGCCLGNECIGSPDYAACGSAGGACVPCRNNENCIEGFCVPDTCTGCFDSKSSTCLAGNSNDACGSAGSGCAVCGTGTTCSGGRCISSVCTGCIDAATQKCEPGTENALCGAGGKICESCGGNTTCQDQVCQAPPSCGPSNCPQGCCDETDTCRTGDTTTLCGTGGGGCQDCGSGTCTTAKTCKQPCSSSNCDGCCDANGECKPSLPATCGVNGASCKACDAGDLCSAGQCVSLSCSSICTTGCCSQINTCEQGTTNALCGKNGGSCQQCLIGQACVGNVCRVDPNSLWDFVILSAVVPERDQSGELWDNWTGSGLPDTYVEVEFDYGGASYTHKYSSYKSNTLTPTWNPPETVVSGVKAGTLQKANYLTLWDSDGVGVPAPVDDSMEWCSLTVTDAMLSSTLQSKTCTKNGVTWKLYFKFVPH